MGGDLPNRKEIAPPVSTVLPLKARAPRNNIVAHPDTTVVLVVKRKRRACPVHIKMSFTWKHARSVQRDIFVTVWSWMIRIVHMVSSSPRSVHVVSTVDRRRKQEKKTNALKVFHFSDFSKRPALWSSNFRNSRFYEPISFLFTKKKIGQNPPPKNFVTFVRYFLSDKVTNSWWFLISTLTYVISTIYGISYLIIFNYFLNILYCFLEHFPFL